MQRLSFDVPAGATLELTNGSRDAKRYTFECGPFGSIMFVVPPGGKFRFKPATTLPRIIMDDVDPAIPDDDNVIRIDSQD